MEEKVLQNNKMGSAPMLGLILKMSLPAMFSMLVQALYNIVDSYFVAQISENALAAVSLAFPIQNLLIAFAMGTAVGASSLIARRLGEGRQKDADNAAIHGLIFSFFTSLLFALAGWLFSRPFFELFTTDAEIIEMGTIYMSICTIFSFGSFLQICFEKLLQATGNMIWPMVFQLVGAITNIILDPILIFGYFGFPAMGIAGAAVATVLGQIIGMIVGFVVIIFKDHDIHITLRGFRFHARTIKDIYAVGFPAIIMQSVGTVMTMAMNAILATFSTAAYTVFGLYFKLQSFIFMPVFGLTQGLMPIMGFNYGARNKKRLISAIKNGMVIAAIIMFAGMVLFLLIPGQLLQIFNASQELLDIGIPALRTISLCFLPAAIGITISTMFQSVGKGSYSLINSLMRQIVVLIPCAYIFSKFSLNLVWFSFPIADVASLAVTIFLFIRLYRQDIRHLGAPDTQEPAAQPAQ